MIGNYDIVLYNNKVRYHLNIKRNITILKGNSASGKSELIRLISLYNSNPESSGITLICEKECSVLNEENWRIYIETFSERIFFIDEGNGFLKSKEFAEVIRYSNHYYVIVTRENLPQLPYSIEEIYGIKEGDNAGRYRNAKHVYNEMYKLYSNYTKRDIIPKVIITEDSNAGYEFYIEIYGQDKCISSHGKSLVLEMLLKEDKDTILAIVDGAAFGSEMESCMEIIKTSNKRISLYAPESFEYLILKSGIFDISDNILNKTWEYADSTKYFSWEEFYTKYLTDYTRNEIYQYSKKRLNNYYKTTGNVNAIRSTLPFQ